MLQGASQVIIDSGETILARCCFPEIPEKSTRPQLTLFL